MHSFQFLGCNSCYYLIFHPNDRESIAGWNKVELNDWRIMEKTSLDFRMHKNIGNFEALCWNFYSSTISEIGRICLSGSNWICTENWNYAPNFFQINSRLSLQWEKIFLTIWLPFLPTPNWWNNFQPSKHGLLKR